MKPAFQVMDGFLAGSVDGYPSLASLDAEGAGLRESQDLFELYVSDYVTLARCRVRTAALDSVTCLHALLAAAQLQMALKVCVPKLMAACACTLNRHALA